MLLALCAYPTGYTNADPTREGGRVGPAASGNWMLFGDCGEIQAGTYGDPNGRGLEYIYGLVAECTLGADGARVIVIPGAAGGG